METFYYGDYELSEEKKKTEIDDINKDYGKYFELIDECSYKYVMDLFEIWEDRHKTHENGYGLLGFDKLVYDIYDEDYNDEVKLLYDH